MVDAPVINSEYAALFRKHHGMVGKKKAEPQPFKGLWLSDDGSKMRVSWNEAKKRYESEQLGIPPNICHEAEAVHVSRNIAVDLDDWCMLLLKIAYEASYEASRLFHGGDDHLKDLTAQELRKLLQGYLFGKVGKKLHDSMSKSCHSLKDSAIAWQVKSTCA